MSIRTTPKSIVVFVVNVDPGDGVDVHIRFGMVHDGSADAIVAPGTDK